MMCPGCVPVGGGGWLLLELTRALTNNRGHIFGDTLYMCLWVYTHPKSRGIQKRNTGCSSNVVFCHLGFLDIVEIAQQVMETMLLKYRQLEIKAT